MEDAVENFGKKSPNIERKRMAKRRESLLMIKCGDLGYEKKTSCLIRQ